MPDAIFITGATGKTGRSLLPLLAADPAFREALVTCLLHSPPARSILEKFPVQIVEGDASSAESLRSAYRGEGTVVLLSSIFHARAVLEGCRPLRRLIAVSSTGLYSKYRAIAADIAAAEDAIRSAQVPYTIIRPTMIYGTPDDRNISQLIRLVARSKVVPLPGGGSAKFQPIHVDDLASCILAALERPASIGKEYDVGGGSAHTLREMVEMAAALLGKRAATVSIPMGLALAAVGFAERLTPRPRIRREQIERLFEDKTFDISAAARDLGFAPRDFETGLAREIEAMGLGTRERH